MAIRPLRYFGDPVLKSPSEPVTVFDAKLKSLVDDLMESVTLPGRAGLAAPQIGVGQRAFSYLVDGQHGYVINPELVELSEKIQDGVEGCLSVPGMNFPTRRAKSATVRGVDVNNEPVVVSGRGELARCLQHETDHLDGLLYLDRLDPAQRKEAFRLARSSDWFWKAR
ncbi:peptide deformylase [Allokutzneria sp. A3M-2-11 16]|uniref:peptide deformylase n=1 Tax=Allokutzneria sp. A3M-2-11 16 TaxID=2962043 RepID=UPI0020B7977A|nr:peptide deformylase [Allokutzneria sp. A3M-2-11 16]MCP3801472.1 peptide deformylase [Allokutzneria sp. A3M-2-11 16]